MRVQRRLMSVVSLSVLLVMPGCDDSGPTTGAIRVITQTTGGDLDLDGYVAVVDSLPHLIGIDGSLMLAGLPTGAHDVWLTGIAANCVSASATRSAVVRAGDTTDVVFPVTCAATGIRITASTGGLDLDSSGYSVSVDGVMRGSVDDNRTLEVTRLPAGSHAVTLSGVAWNCTISGPDTLSVNVVAGTIAQVAFDLSCTAISGVVAVSVTTTGVELDANGYRIQIGSSPAFSPPIGVNGTVHVPGIAIGTHRVSIIDRTSNCSVAPEHPRDVTVVTSTSVRDTARVAFEVNCVATRGNIQITAVTSGTQLDPGGYFLELDKSCDYSGCQSYWEGTVASNGEVTVTGVPEGEHWLSIADISRNCTMAASNPRLVNVGAAVTTVVPIEVSCVEAGRVELTVATAGVDLDPNGYRVSLSGPTGVARDIGANGTVTLDTLRPGDYEVSLSDVMLNCEITGANPRTVSVLSGSTAPLLFELTCAAAPILALVSDLDGNSEIYLVKANGAALTRLTANLAIDGDPAWSPDGSKLAFTSDRGGNTDIYVMNADGSNQTRLTDHSAPDYQPTWSPDGSRIAFASNRDGNTNVYVMNADGSNPVRLTVDGAADGDPYWSSTNLIAFWSDRLGAAEIWVMDADGANQRNVTSTGSNFAPAWSADGARIVYRHDGGCDYYYCYYDLFVVNADGSGNATITGGVEVSTLDPSWSADGEWIALASQECSSYYYYYPYCHATGIAVIHPNGLGYMNILDGSYHSPAWRPGGN